MTVSCARLFVACLQMYHLKRPSRYVPNRDSQSYFLKDVFLELMHSATSMIEFSFDNVIYKQIDRVARGSPLGPALANIFVGNHEKKSFSKK